MTLNSPTDFVSERARRAIWAVTLTLSLIAAQLAVLAPTAQAETDTGGGWNPQRIVVEFDDAPAFEWRTGDPVPEDGPFDGLWGRGGDLGLFQTPEVIHLSCSQNLTGRTVVDMDGNELTITRWALDSRNPAGNQRRVCGSEASPTISGDCAGSRLDPAVDYSIDFGGALGVMLYVDGERIGSVYDGDELPRIEWPTSNGALADEVELELRYRSFTGSSESDLVRSTTIALEDCPLPDLDIDLDKSVIDPADGRVATTVRRHLG